MLIDYPLQFAQLEHAKAAQSVNGKLEIAGRFLKVRLSLLESDLSLFILFVLKRFLFLLFTVH